ncbi:MAG: FG-GAP repeat protein [Pirellulaceae bacterium]
MNNWTEALKLAAPTPAAGDYFGLSVGLSGDVAAIGTAGEHALVYQRDGNGEWTQTQQLQTDSQTVQFLRLWRVKQANVIQSAAETTLMSRMAAQRGLYSIDNPMGSSPVVRSCLHTVVPSGDGFSYQFPIQTVIASLPRPVKNSVYVYQQIDGEWELEHQLRSEFFFGLAANIDGETLIATNFVSPEFNVNPMSLIFRRRLIG